MSAGIPKSHPRKLSLDVRHKLVSGFRRGLVAAEGLIAHGRGEAFDYLLGEKTVGLARDAVEAAAAMLLLAKKPVVSVNGNAAALVPEGIIELADVVDAAVEVNLFYRTNGRESKIADALKKAGAGRVYGLEKKHGIPNLSSGRANVDDALWGADMVLVLLEDGDRTGALKKAGKKVIAVDLNPLSRTAQTADITIVDNITRAFPNMIKLAGELKDREKNELAAITEKFDNKRNLKEIEELMRSAIK